MNVDAALLAGFNRMPGSVKGPVTFTNKDGNQTTACQATGVPGKPTLADDYQAATLIREKTRRLSVLSAGLRFVPQAGMTVQWEGRPWTVDGVNPFNPAGLEITDQNVTAIPLFRVAISR